MDITGRLEDPAPALRKIDELERMRGTLARELAAIETKQAQSVVAADVTEDQVNRLLTDLAAEARESDRSALRSALVGLVGGVGRASGTRPTDPVRNTPLPGYGPRFGG